MNPLLKMAWLNLWRNPRRTAILLCAMAAGLVGILFSMAFVNGWTGQLVADSVGTYEGHVKILARGYNENPVIENSFEPSDRIEAALAADPRVKSWVPRVAVQGLLSTPEHSLVVTVIGTDPVREPQVSTASRMLVGGRALSGESRGEILLGRDLAEKIRKGPGKKVVLMSQQLGGEIGTAAFRAVGLFDAGNGGYNEATVYVTLDEVRPMLNLGGRVTEIAVLLHDTGQSDAVAAGLSARLNDPALEVLTWRERLPYIHEMLEMMGRYTWIYYAIFYIAMAFGIVNTLLISIGERTHEIGVLMAVGTTRTRLMLLILLESFFIAVVAVVAGLATGGALVAWFNVRGIDLSAFAEGMDLYGMAHVIRPVLADADLYTASAGTFVISIVFSLLPAWRAARLVPVEALRKGG
jgi:ABC-type lipoprotein release transport system permease subunit